MAKKKKVVKKAVKKQVAKKTAMKKTTTKKVIKKSVQKTKVKKVIKKVVKKVNVKKVNVKAAVKITKKVTAKPVIKPSVDYSKAVTPLGDRLVVRVVKSETMTAGGLYIPDMAQSSDGYLKGEVLAAGQGHTTKKGFLRSMDVQKGDQVLFAEHAGTKVVFNSEELQIVNETDVLGIIQSK